MTKQIQKAAGDTEADIQKRDQLLVEEREAGRKARSKVYELQLENAKLKDQVSRLNERRQQLEQIVASSFARSVKMLSGSQKQIGASQDAANVVRIVEDHFVAERLMKENQVPSATVAGAMQFLIDCWKKQVEVSAEGTFFQGVDLGFTNNMSFAVVTVEVEAVDDKPTPLLPPAEAGAYSVRPGTK
jgi:hypothetical protein